MFQFCYKDASQNKDTKAQNLISYPEEKDVFLAPWGAQEMQMFIRLSSEKCSKAHKNYISLPGQSWESLRSV